MRCFNGATSLWTWKALTCKQLTHNGQASMGPRRCGHGKYRYGGGLNEGGCASMGPRRCGHGKSGQVIYTPLATALQWGHVAVDMERCRSLRLGAPSWTLQWGHVAVDMESWGRCLPALAPSCFNGATSLWTWKARGCLLCRGRGAASMGPRRCGHGKDLSCRRALIYGPLQWGHVAVDMES